jgi:hypothetical protein
LRSHRVTLFDGTASATPFAIIVLIPITRPRASASGPPEFPGASLRSAWIHERPFGVRGPTACTTPAVSAPPPVAAAAPAKAPVFRKSRRETPDFLFMTPPPLGSTGKYSARVS